MLLSLQRATSAGCLRGLEIFLGKASVISQINLETKNRRGQTTVPPARKNYRVPAKAMTRSILRLHTAGSHHAPASKRLEQHKHSGTNQCDARPEIPETCRDAGHQARPAHATADDAAGAIDVRVEKLWHGQVLAHRRAEANRRQKNHRQDCSRLRCCVLYGVWSSVRNLVPGHSGTRHSGYTAWRATIAVTNQLPALLRELCDQQAVGAFLSAGVHVASLQGRSQSGVAKKGNSVGASRATRRQNVCNRSARCASRFPAMIAPLIAPIEVPTIQSIFMPCSTSASNAPP